MNQADNKLLASLFKRLQELDQENQILKSKLNKQQSSTNSEPYLRIKELIIANPRQEQLCSLCDCEINAGQVINSLQLYFCANNCSLLLEKAVEEIIYQLRKKTN